MLFIPRRCYLTQVLPCFPRPSHTTYRLGVQYLDVVEELLEGTLVVESFLSDKQFFRLNENFFLLQTNTQKNLKALLLRFNDNSARFGAFCPSSYLLTAYWSSRHSRLSSIYYISLWRHNLQSEPNILRASQVERFGRWTQITDRLPT